jgi:hypothetical protein
VSGQVKCNAEALLASSQVLSIKLVALLHRAEASVLPAFVSLLFLSRRRTKSTKQRAHAQNRPHTAPGGWSRASVCTWSRADRECMGRRREFRRAGPRCLPWCTQASPQCPAQTKMSCRATENAMAAVLNNTQRSKKNKQTHKQTNTKFRTSGVFQTSLFGSAPFISLDATAAHAGFSALLARKRCAERDIPPALSTMSQIIQAQDQEGAASGHSQSGATPCSLGTCVCDQFRLQ